MLMNIYKLVVSMVNIILGVHDMKTKYEPPVFDKDGAPAGLKHDAHLHP